METINRKDTKAQFSEINHHTALEQITLRAAQEATYGLYLPQLPIIKVLEVRSLINEKSTRIASTPLDAKLIVPTCRIQIDFAERILTMQISLTGSLLEPQNL